MKKIVSIIIVIVSLLLIGTIFLFTNKKIDLVESNLEIANPKDLKLEVIENTNTSLRWKVINNTGKEVTTSYELFIEKFNDDFDTAKKNLEECQEIVDQFTYIKENEL